MKSTSAMRKFLPMEQSKLANLFRGEPFGHPNKAGLCEKPVKRFQHLT